MNRTMFNGQFGELTSGMHETTDDLGDYCNAVLKWKMANVRMVNWTALSYPLSTLFQPAESTCDLVPRFCSVRQLHSSAYHTVKPRSYWVEWLLEKVRNHWICLCIIRKRLQESMLVRSTAVIQWLDKHPDKMQGGCWTDIFEIKVVSPLCCWDCYRTFAATR